MKKGAASGIKESYALLARRRADDDLIGDYFDVNGPFEQTQNSHHVSL